MQKSQLLQNKPPVGTDWEKIIDEIDLKIVPTFLIQEVHFIYPDCPDVVMALDQLDANTLAMLGDNIRDLSADSKARIRLVIDARKLQVHIEPFVEQVLQSLP